MAKILLSAEVKRVQNELRRLSALLRKPGAFKLELTYEGAKLTKLIQEWIQGNITLLGSYKEDDVDGNLDVNKSVIANLSIAVSNITSVINRLNALDIKVNTLENTKADKTTTDALQSDINDLVEAIVSQEVWTGDFAIPLPASDNIVPWSAEITNALNGISAGQKITLKLQNMTGDPVSIFLEESVNDNSFTSESFNGDPDVQVKVTTAQFELNGLMAQMRGDYKLIEIRSIPAEVKVDLSNLATIDLSNVNVGVANAGKLAKVKADGGLEYVVAPIPNGYEEKEITITPAVYGWKDITNEYETKQYTQEDIGKKIKITAVSGEFVGLIGASGGAQLPKISVHMGYFELNQDTENAISFYSSYKPNKLGQLVLREKPQIINNKEEYDISKFEIWDIITPAVKATVPVKK